MILKLKFINLNSNHKILSYPKITKIQATSQTLLNQIPIPKSQTLISLSQQKEIFCKYWHIENVIRYRKNS